MVANSDGSYKKLKPDVTGRGEVEQAILRTLEASALHIQPKVIANRSHQNPSSVRVTLRRMAQQNKVVKLKDGYALPKQTFEQDLERELKLNGQKEALPKVHDVHLTFKTENLKKVMSQPDMVASFNSKFEYVSTDRGPDGTQLQMTLIPDYKNIPCLSNGDFYNCFFNPLDKRSIYQLWNALAPYPCGDKVRHRDIKGGFQDTFNNDTWELIVQIYTSTGTIKVIFSNSEHPFDAIQFREAIIFVSGIFIARTGVCFLDVAPFFYIEKVHLGNDIRGDREFSGTTRLNCTVYQLDGWLFRTYEKVLGDELYIRNETCLERGNFDDHNLNAFIGLIEGGTNPTLEAALIHKLSQFMQQEYPNDLRRTQNQIHELYQMLKFLIQDKASTKGG